LRGEDRVVAFDFGTGHFAGAVVQLARLNGQALVVVPYPPVPLARGRQAGPGRLTISDLAPVSACSRCPARDLTGSCGSRMMTGSAGGWSGAVPVTEIAFG